MTILYKIFLTSLLGLVVISQLSAQNINTPMPTVPFGTNSGYPYGFLPTNLPASGTYGASQDAADAYFAWYADWVQTCSDGTRYVIHDANPSVSEGIAYGMIIAAYMGDKDFFDDLWKFYENGSNERGLMDWNSGCEGPNGGGAATDAEMDAAMALIIAEYQWPNLNTPYDYATEAEDLITAVYNYEVQDDNKTGPNQLLNGDQWGTGGDNCRNPGYIAMGYLKEFATFVGGAQGTDWNDNIIPANYALIQSSFHPTTGLGPDWCRADGTPGGCGDGGSYGDDACRIPWRTAVDAMWFGESSSMTHCTNVAKLCAERGGPATTPGFIDIDGTGDGTVNLIFQSMYAAGVVGADPSTSGLANGYTMQSLLNDYYTTVNNTDSPYYFHSILKMISMLMMTGNFWRPGDEIGQCSRPDLGEAASLCGAGSVTLESGLATGNNRQFSWYKDDVLQQGPSSNLNSITVTEAGIWTVEVDSANGECVVSDQVEVLGILPTIDLGDDVELCSPAMVSLDASISGNALSYSWEKDNVVMEGENAATLDVFEAGVYDVFISASGCDDVTDQIIVSSSLPEVVGGTVCPPGPITLEVLTPGGPYEWYDQPVGGTRLGTGSSFQTDISTTTLFYVEDAGSIDLTVGIEQNSNSLTDGAGRGGNQDEMVLQFDALTGFTLESLTVEYYSYNCTGETTVQINIENSGTGFSASATGTLPCDGQGPSVGELILDTPIDIPAGTGFTIDADGSDRALEWYRSGATYPFGVEDVISITGPHPSLNWAPNSYPGFFDWHITTGNSCDRAAVQAEADCVNSFEEIIASSAFTLFPNPATEVVLMRSELELSSVEITDHTGQRISAKIDLLEGSIHLGDLAPGTYFVRLNNSVVKKVVKF